MGVVEKCLDHQARSLQPLSQVCVANERVPQRAKVHNGTEVCRPSDTDQMKPITRPAEYGYLVTRFRLTACIVNAIRFSTPTLRISLPTWALTVAASIPSASAISRFG